MVHWVICELIHKIFQTNNTFIESKQEIEPTSIRISWQIIFADHHVMICIQLPEFAVDHVKMFVRKEIHNLMDEKNIEMLRFIARKRLG